MKILFFGSSSFSVPSLEKIKRYVSLVVTKKAKPKGRGYILEDNEVKKKAVELGIDHVEIDSISELNVDELKSRKFDLIVTVSFGFILPKAVLDIPSLGPINVHPSLLPKYRGPSPIQEVLLEGEKETGITIIKMNERMDAGDILYQERFEIFDDDDAVSLSQKLSQRSGEILLEFLKKVEEGGLPEGFPQDESKATYTRVIRKEMANIDWSKSAREIVNMIRAYAYWPVAYTHYEGKLLKIFKAKPVDCSRAYDPGIIVGVSKDGILCSTGSGMVLLTEVQLEGKRRMSAYEFAKGARDLVGRRLI